MDNKVRVVDLTTLKQRRTVRIYVNLYKEGNPGLHHSEYAAWALKGEDPAIAVAVPIDIIYEV